MTRIAYLPGDGVGPEVLAVARDVLTAAGFQAEWVDLPVGWEEWRLRGDALPAKTIEAMRSTNAALFGAITSKPDVEAEAELTPALRGTGLRYRSPILRLRHEFGLGVNMRPVRTIPGSPGALSAEIDIVIFRENTEGLYAGLEAHPLPDALRIAVLDAIPGGRALEAGPDTAIALRLITRRATMNVCRAAFEYAARAGRRNVTLVDKPNVLRLTGGLVRKIFADVSSDFPEIETQELHIDAACARLVTDPEAFDVVVATNLFGDILSDVAAAVAGGLPLAASANLGGSYALFEPVHGSAPDIAGQGLANPLGAVLAGAMLARHAGQAAVADRVERAARRLVAHGGTLPQDMGGTAATADVASALVTLITASQRPAPLNEKAGSSHRKRTK